MPVTFMKRNLYHQNSNYTIQIYKLAYSNFPFIFMLSQLINLNSVIRILVIQVSLQECDWHNLFPILFYVCIFCMNILF